MKRLAPMLALVAAVLAAVGVAVWLHHDEPEPEPEPPSIEEGETGLSRDATEERMRAIGYVQ
jgi:hypothetical protein